VARRLVLGTSRRWFESNLSDQYPRRGTAALGLLSRGVPVRVRPRVPVCLARLTVGPHSYKVQIGVQLVGEVPVRGGRLRKDACLSSRITRVQIPSAAPDTPVVQRMGARLRIWSMQVRVLPGVPFSAPPAETDRRLLIASRQVKFLCGAPYSRGVVDAHQIPNLRVAGSIPAGSANRACSPTAGGGGFKSRTVSVRI
jgi:hypothetical protein